MEVSINPKDFVVGCWQAGVAAVEGQGVTRTALERDGIERITHLLAVGKAASTMTRGALPFLDNDGKVLVITKDDHVDEEIRHHPNIDIIESSHPVPDERSLFAGQRALEFVKSVPADQEMVMLVSGGASALVESLPESISLSDLRQITEELLSDGYSIDQINAVRIKLSRVKGGKLLRSFNGGWATVYGISDIPSDDMDLIGSGIGSISPAQVTDFPLSERIKAFFDLVPADSEETKAPLPFQYRGEIIASNRIAREAVEEYASGHDYVIIANEMALNDDVFDVADRIIEALQSGPAGVYIWGGEPTIMLPASPGNGGRNQSLALAIARGIQESENITVIVAGTDGTDGPTYAAGGVVTGQTFRRFPGGDQALENADAGTWLNKADALFAPGPTGTNVMDLVIAIKT